MEKAIQNKNFNCKSKDALENHFLEFLKAKYENKEVDSKSLNIIKEREEFLDKLVIFNE